jgi:ABC-type phosphate transport system, permease component
MDKIESKKDRTWQKRAIKDGCRKLITWLSAGCALALLAAIFVNIAQGGASLLSWDLLTSDYASATYTYQSSATSATYADPGIADVSYSSAWGVAFKNETSFTGESVVALVYLAPASPIGKLDSKVAVGTYFTKAFLTDANGGTIIALAKDSASGVKDAFEEGKSLASFSITTKGGGIRGSLLSTLLVIAVSLLLSLPLGIGAAIYFAYFAPKKSKIVKILEKMIDVTSGIPSIVFGLIGVAVFIPFSSLFTGVNTGSLLSGCFTLVIILLPTIVKTAEEALDEVPKEYRTASLALGGSERQTLHKIILPTALPGLLSAAVLAAGRIIGESAALVFAVGNVIGDSVALADKNDTLAVEIWSLLAGENPNYRLASAIALIILIVISILSLSAKLLTALFLKKRGHA